MPGIFVIGALAGYPLIKHCMNQGHDVVEFINGNTRSSPLTSRSWRPSSPALPGDRSVEEWLEMLRSNVTHSQRAVALADARVHARQRGALYRAGAVVFERNHPGSSLFAIADGSVLVEVDPKDPGMTVPIAKGSIFGEVGLISGRRARRDDPHRRGCDPGRGVAHSPRCRLMAAVPAARRAVTRISVERQLLQMFGAGLTSADLEPSTRR